MGRTKAVENIPPQTSSMVVNLPSPPPAKSSDFLKAYSSWVYASVNAIAQEVANIELSLYRRKYTNKGVEVEEVTEHEALSLLYEVNNFMTHYQLFEITQIYLELMGEAYWVILRDSKGNPSQLWPLRPDWVFINPSSDFIDSYKYSPGGVADPKAIVIQKKDMIPFKYPNPTNPYRGRGAVQAAAVAIDTDQFSSEWNRNFFYNSAVPYLILRTKKKPSKEEMNRFMAQWEAKFQGKANSHKIAMLTGDWEDPFVFGDKFRDMDFIEQRRMMRDEILGMFRVGKSTLNLTEDVNRANAEASNLNFMERVVTPKMVRFVSHLNEFYLRQNWGDEDLFFDFEDPAPADVETNLKIYENGKNYWLTPNEIRQMENLPPLDGGDIIPVPFSVVPLDSLSGSSSADNTDNASKDQNQGKSGFIILRGKSGEVKKKYMMPLPPKRLAQMKKESVKKELKHDLFKLVKNLMIEVENKEKKNKVNTKGKLTWNEEQRTAYWKKMVAKTDVFERKIKGEVKNLFSDQRDEVLKNIERDRKFYARTKGKETSFLFNLIAENKKWKRLLGPLIKSIVIDKGREVFDLLGIDQSLDLTQQAAQLFLKVEGLSFVQDVNEETRKQLKDTLAEGLGREEGIPDLKKRVNDVFNIADGSRSEKIARTEVLRSTNFATVEAYRQSEIVEGKEWLTARDERVDEECQALDGKVIGLDGEFKEGEFSGDYPPLHPNCRCTLIPVLKNE